MEVTENQIGELNKKEKLEMDINSCKSFVWLACVVNMVSGSSLIVLLCSFVVYPYFYINKLSNIFISLLVPSLLSLHSWSHVVLA